ncbi:MAG: TIM barrel protein [Verrucomicrobiota bacterium]
MTRRHALGLFAGTTVASSCAEASVEDFALRYVLSSAMYGEMALDTILPEVAKTGSESLDIWCKKHGNQREQADKMGEEAFAALLEKYEAKLDVSTRYPFGPFGLQEEMRWLQKFGGEIVVTGSGRHGPMEPEGTEAKKQLQAFLEKMKPHLAVAEECGVTIAIENHDRQMLYHPDSLRYFAELNTSPHLGVAFAPHHLHQWVEQIPQLLRDLGDAHIPFIYFQEHSAGIREKAPKEIEMQQLPGFGGGLDYKGVTAALRDINYSGLVEIFMHPVPRGVPILPTVREITAAINKSRAYVEKCLAFSAP